MSATPVNSRTSNFVARGRHEWTVEDFARREEGNGVSLQTRQVFEYTENVFQVCFPYLWLAITLFKGFKEFYQTNEKFFNSEGFLKNDLLSLHYFR